jgi:hypothetical protein
MPAFRPLSPRSASLGWQVPNDHLWLQVPQVFRPYHYVRFVHLCPRCPKGGEMNVRSEMTELFLDWASCRFYSLLDHFTEFEQIAELAADVRKRAAWLDLDDERITDLLSRMDDWASSGDVRDCGGTIPGCEEGCYCD